MAEQEQINENPFSIDVDIYGNPVVNPQMANAYFCWYETDRRRRLMYCCWTSNGKECWRVNMKILDESPPDPGQPSEEKKAI